MQFSGPKACVAFGARGSGFGANGRSRPITFKWPSVLRPIEGRSPYAGSHHRGWEQSHLQRRSWLPQQRDQIQSGCPCCRRLSGGFGPAPTAAPVFSNSAQTWCLPTAHLTGTRLRRSPTAATPTASSWMKASFCTSGPTSTSPGALRCFVPVSRPTRRCVTGASRRAKRWALSALAGGHMGVKFAHAFGAHTIVFTTSLNKKEDALRLGADEVVVSRNADEMQKHAGTFDFILDCVAADHDINAYINLLTRDGNITLVGAPEKPLPVSAFGLIFGRRSLSGSPIGGIPETQEMLDFCGQHNITADVEVIPIQKINEAYERMVRSDVKYRFSIDMASLKAE
jgi:hypothetical protein